MNNKSIEHINLGELTEPQYLLFKSIVASKNQNKADKNQLQLAKPINFLNKRPKMKKIEVQKSRKEPKSKLINIKTPNVESKKCFKKSI